MLFIRNDGRTLDADPHFAPALKAMGWQPATNPAPEGTAPADEPATTRRKAKTS